MITIINKPPILRRFKVWDLEWVPGTYQLRLCGTFDPWVGYHRYLTMDDLIRNELTPSTRGVWFYAHFGGMADLQFLLEALTDKQSYRVRGSFSGASCVIAHVRVGRMAWHFVDSFWLLRSPLRDIAKSMGMEKTGPANTMSDRERKEWYATVSLPELTEYNENDCRVLWEGIHRAQCSILELGGQLQMTLASTAMQLFRRRYLKEDVETTKAINKIASGSYIASRVEVYQRQVDYPGLYYDVNSSFPYAMTFAMPGRLRSNHRDIPQSGWDFYPFIADCEIEVPETYLPPLAYRWKEKVFFPIGRWRSWFNGIDLKLLLREGGTIRRVYACKLFEPLFDLQEYANDLYQRRAKTADPFEREFYKLLLNSLYGKFAEQAEKTNLIVNPDANQLQELNRTTDMLFPGVFFKCSEVPIPHAHVPISSYITAIARQTLFDYMAQASEIHYCDTDGFSTVDEFPVGRQLGELKLEKTFETATFLVPKLYRWQPGHGASPVVKAKGFSLGREGRCSKCINQEEPCQTTEHFDRLVSGGEIQVQRMARIRENLRNRIIRPRDLTVTKRLRQLDFLQGTYRLDTMPKRFMYPDGHTRPWSLTEILK